MTTHIFPGTTRMEDIAGLESGDTIQFNGHELTCESDMGEVTGLFGTGTGTLRMLAGGHADFSGSNPLPSTIKIVAGSEETPLPAHGDHGYIGRAAAVLDLKSGSTFDGDIEVHSATNESRKQMTKIVAQTNTTTTLEEDMGLEAGDELAILETYRYTSSGTRIVFIVVTAYDPATRTVTHESNTSARTGFFAALATTAFVVTGKGGEIHVSGRVTGDEVGFTTYYSGTGRHYIARNANIQLRRMVVMSVHSGVRPDNGHVFDDYCVATVGTFVSFNHANAFGAQPLLLSFGKCFCLGLKDQADTSEAVFRNIVFQGGRFAYDTPLKMITGRLLFENFELTPGYDSIHQNGSMTVRTTGGEQETCTVHRAGGLATLAHRSDFMVPTDLPDAWLLSPLDGGTAWHDEETVVPPGKTLTVQWYCFLGEDGARAGVAVLDGECMDDRESYPTEMFDVLAEYEVPAGTAALEWLPAVRLSWRNKERRARRVVLRGWAKGGQVYSRIGTTPGGVA